VLRTRQRRPSDEPRDAPPGGFLLVLAALAALAGPAADAAADVRKLRLRVGERREVRVPAAEPRARVAWRMDGRPLPAEGPVFELAPRAEDVGNHRLTAEVQASGGPVEHAWAVRIEPPRPPRIVAAGPPSAAIVLGPNATVDLVLRARPSGEAETVATSWTIDGRPAGEGERLRVTAPAVGTVRVRALAVGSLGSAVAREWAVTARATVLAAATPTTLPLFPPTTTTTEPPPPTTSTTLPPLPTTSTTVRPLAPTSTSATAPTATTTTGPPTAASTTSTALVVAAAPTPTSTRPTAPSTSASAEVTARDVEAFLKRYSDAWRRHDAAELRLLGQVSTDAQEAALRDYFARVRDLDVEVQVLDVFVSGDRRTVRFTRRDSFRDPSGRLVAKETPPLEKDVVRTPSGLRFAPSDR
jgi:hypothetical protein